MKPSEHKPLRTRRQTKSKSQKSLHGFYDEFSVLPMSNSSFSRKGSKSTYEKFLNSFKPDEDQTYCDKCLQNMRSCCTKQCTFKLFPILLWLPSYQIGWFKKDLMSGVTVSILLVPQSLAYATLAGLPPEWGLYASVMPIFLYTFWSTSCAVAVGPVATTAIMIASAVEGILSNLGDLSQSDPGYDELYQSIAMTLSFVCGIIFIVFGLIQAGFIIVFLSRPVMTGFIMSAAFIILVNQFRSLFGLDMQRYPLFYQTLIAMFDNLHTINWYTTLISIISLFILFLPKCCLKGKIPKWLPVPLIDIAMWILISYFANLENKVAIIGNDIKAGFPAPKPPNFAYMGDVFASAIVVTIVSYMGAIALAKGFDQKRTETYKQELSQYTAYCRDNVDTVELNISNCNDSKSSKNEAKAAPKEFSMQSTEDEENEEEGTPGIKCKKPLSLPPIELSANMEFIAFGISNLLGSFFSSQVISASFSRSALNFDMNGWTQISSIIQAIICLLCLLVLMPLLSPLPKCVLASLVTVSVYRLIKNGVHEFIFLWRVSSIELVEFMVAFIAPLVIGLEIGIFLAIGTSILVNLLRHSFTQIVFLGRLHSTMSDEAEYVDCALFKQSKSVPHITIIEMKAELSFSNNNRLVDKLRRLLAGGNKYIVVSLNLTSFIDTTSIRQIVTIFEDSKGSYICLSQCRPKVIELIHCYEKDTDEFPDNVKTFVSTHDAVLYLNSIRSKLHHQSDVYHSTSDSDENGVLSSFSKPSLDRNINTVTPHHTFREPELSDDIQHISARKATFSFFAGQRTKSHSNQALVGTDSDDITDPDGDQLQAVKINENDIVIHENENEHMHKLESIASITDVDVEQDNNDYIGYLEFGDVDVIDVDAKPCPRLSSSLNPAKIDEDKEVDQI